MNEIKDAARKVRATLAAEAYAKNLAESNQLEYLRKVRGEYQACIDALKALQEHDIIEPYQAHAMYLKIVEKFTIGGDF